VIDDRSRRALCQQFPKRPSLLRLRPFAAIHVERQSNDQRVSTRPGRLAQMYLNCGSKTIKQQLAAIGSDRALNDFKWRDQSRLAIPKREPRPLVPKINREISHRSTSRPNSDFWF